MELLKNERKIKMDGACIKRIYFFAILVLQLIAYPIAVFNIGEYNDWVYYGIILSCFITSAVFLTKDVQSYLQLGALFFTCIADFCLILGQASYTTGVAFFLVVQLFYAARTLFLAKSEKERMINLSLRGGLCFAGALVVVFLFGEKTQALYILSILYYVNLLVSIAFAFLHFRENKLLAIGLTLFVLCDTVLGLQNIIDIFSISHESLFYAVVHPKFALEAAFYCPSQVLLSVSACNFTKTGE